MRSQKTPERKNEVDIAAVRDRECFLRDTFLILDEANGLGPLNGCAGSLNSAFKRVLRMIVQAVAHGREHTIV